MPELISRLWQAPKLYCHLNNVIMSCILIFVTMDCILYKQTMYKYYYLCVDMFKFTLVSADPTMNFVVIRKELSKKWRTNQALRVGSMQFVQRMIRDSSESLLCIVFSTWSIIITLILVELSRESLLWISRCWMLRPVAQKGMFVRREVIQYVRVFNKYYWKGPRSCVCGWSGCITCKARWFYRLEALIIISVRRDFSSCVVWTPLFLMNQFLCAIWRCVVWSVRPNFPKAFSADVFKHP